MIFYKYTIKKMLTAVSTWITLIIAGIIVWGFAISSFFLKSNSFESTFIFISFFSFPLPMIFLTYQVIKIFRDEIDNKTILSLQTKPISRRSMVLQGILALFTSIFSMLVIVILLPGFLIAIKETRMFLTTISIFASYFLMLSIFAIICLQLSLKLSGKSLIGVIIGLFSVGFYVVYFISLGLKSLSSVENNTHTFIAKLKDNEKFSINTSKNLKISIHTNVSSGSLDESTKEVEELYKIAKDNNNVGIYDVVEWFNPTSHFMRMVGAFIKDNNNLDNKNNIQSMNNYPLKSMFSGKSLYIKNLEKKNDNTGNIQSFSFELDKRKSYPTFYPFILWISLGVLFVPLSIRSIQKKNIS